MKVEIVTEFDVIGFDDAFDDDMNIICSDENTSGKSSILSSIYYALGLEEIIGGKGYNVLTSAFKTKVHYDNKDLDVIESKIFLEIFNGNEEVTILRAAKMENRESNLMTVYYSEMNKIYDKDTKKEDMYVHLQNSATNNKGFFTFLENFIGLDLPYVPTNDDKERKLYLQLVFSSMLIEQKRGWSDLFSGMPHFGIKEPKKRVIEYLLNMDTLKNEKLKHNLKIAKREITENWNGLYNNTVRSLGDLGLSIIGVNNEVKILDDEPINIVFQEHDKVYSLEEYIEQKENEYNNLIKTKPKKIENFNELKEELNKIDEETIKFEEKIRTLKIEFNNEKNSLDRLLSSLQIIQTDIVNNQDAKKLRSLGSTEGFKTFKDICPTCHQTISDSLLVGQNSDNEVMSIDDNIKHLKSQENLFEFAIEQKKANLIRIEKDLSNLEKNLSKLYQLARVTRNDIFEIHGSISEATIYKKVELSKTLDELKKISNQTGDIEDMFKNLSDKWKEYLNNYKKLPENRLTDLDETKIRSLRNNFVANLKEFGYRSSADIDKVMISKDTYMPIIENFDLKFDSSASDHIRRIWAFTIAMVQTSDEFDGNHPGILVFDEPGQHSIIVKDMEAFLDRLIEISSKNQVIVGITIKETDTKKLIYKKINSGSNGIVIQDRAFNKLR
ncbi:hypothetical protein NLX67_15075 [Domibacillus sp. A3M-37]|uniref:hypothetical protein n=1 Tax=Domibacillus sp. A3M-37 TaxID=2962037 RepID=UPI0020B63CFF|nr:hypothetical protein [Domibacillus sp. A3M-37]MCP3763697.1 hypothetical protein [Domibacillus sp. A3M-37]